MAAIDFQDIAHLVNFSRTTEIELSPLKIKEGRWSLHQGTHRVHTSVYPFSVLYFSSAASLAEIISALRGDQGNLVQDDTHIVYAPSLDKFFRRSPDKYLPVLLKRAKGAWSTREYLVSFIKDELQTYLKRIGRQDPKDYINPRVETPSGFAIKVPNPLLSFLRDPQLSDTDWDWPSEESGECGSCSHVMSQLG